MEQLVNKKVSLLVPCYNGQDYLDYFFESLISQTYSNVEFIFVDDGSTDNTKNYYEKYEPLLIKKGWNCQYIYQENQGQASAINNGLKLITGEYLIFPDSDDILYPNHIEEKVKYMEQNPEFGMAYCILDVCNITDLSKICCHLNNIPDDNMFQHALKDNVSKILWPPIGNIVRISALFEVLNDKSISTSIAGQNSQIQIPLLYKYKCGYIPKPLGKYIVRQSSHSRTSLKERGFFNRRLDLLKTFLRVINFVKFESNEEKNRSRLICIIAFLKRISKHYLQQIFSVKNETIDYQKYKVLTIFGFKFKRIRK